MSILEVMALIGVTILLATGMYMIVKVEQMSDEDREKIGHGPKGQGR